MGIRSLPVQYSRPNPVRCVTSACVLNGISPEPGGKKRSVVKQFTVTIEEHIAQEFPVEHRDIFHAIKHAEDMYKRGSFVVQPSAPNVRLIMARDEETGDTTEWKAF